MIDRRAFIGGLAFGTAVTAHIGRAQPAGKVYRIGILSSGSTTSAMVGPEPQDPRIKALLRGFRELGYVYGAHFVTEPRGGEGKPERFAALAAEVVRLQVDVIVAAGPMLSAVKQATSTIPIVTTGAGDPVASGYAQSLARPGGNITGLSLQVIETVGKRLELLKELVPGAAPVGVLWDPRVSRGSWQAAESAARGRGWRLLSFEIRDVGEIEKAFRSAARYPRWRSPRGPKRTPGRTRSAHRGVGREEPAPRHVCLPVLYRGRWADLLWRGSPRELPACGGFRRQDSEGYQAGGSANRAANEV